MTDRRYAGIVGAKLGWTSHALLLMGAEVVALCETNEKTLANAAKRLKGVTTYTDFDKFIEHEMDGVVLASYFHQHVPLALKALKAGMHVMSELSACKPGRRSHWRAVERAEDLPFAENYPCFQSNQGDRRCTQQGAIGEYTR